MIDKNPFNPKNPFKKEDKEFLFYSLKKWGLVQSLLVIPSYKNPERFITIDGHSRIENYNQDDELDFEVYTKEVIDSDEKLKEFTLDYLSAVKDRNKKMLSEIYYDLNKQEDIYKSIYEKLQVKISDIQEEYREKKEKDFNKNVVLKFKSQNAYEMFEYYTGKTKNIIQEKNKKLWFALEEATENLNVDLIEKYFFDIIFIESDINGTKN